MKREIHTTTQIRPPKFVWLVDSVKSLENATQSLVHLWGGSGSYVFPVPRKPKELALFQTCLMLADPDIVIGNRERLPGEVVKIVDRQGVHFIPYVPENRLLTVWNEDRLVDYKDRVFVSTLASLRGVDRLPPILMAGEQSAQYRLGIDVQGGIAGDALKSFLTKRAKVSLLKEIGSFGEYLRGSLLLAQNRSVRSLGVEGLGSSMHPLVHHETQCTDFLCVYLYRKDDYRIPSLYWNHSGVMRENKMLVPQSQFVNNIEDVCRFLIGAFEKPKHLYVFCNMSKGDAKTVQYRLATTMEALYSKQVHVKVEYKPNYYGWDYRVLTWGPKTPDSTVLEDGDEEVQVSAIVPACCESTATMFAYSLSITNEEDNIVALPNNELISRILTYGSRLIDYYAPKYERLSKWHSNAMVRANDGALQGLASERLLNRSRAGVRVYLPSNTDIARLYVEQKGYVIRPNDPAHYARAFLRNYGTLDSRHREWLGNDMVVATVLRNNKSSCVYGLKQIKVKVTKLAKQTDRTEKSEIDVAGSLKRLIAAGLVRRGYNIACEQCGYKEWHSIGVVSEQVQCLGCGGNTVVPLDVGFTYRLSELALRFFESGGYAVVRAILAFHCVLRPGLVEICGEIWPNRDAKNALFDIDVLRIAEDEIAIVECKDWFRISKSEKRDLRRLLPRLIEAGVSLGVDAIYVAVYSPDDYDSLLPILKSQVMNAKKEGIALRALMNDKLYQWKIERRKLVSEILGMDYARIDRSPDAALLHRFTVGNGPSSYGSGIMSQSMAEGYLDGLREQLVLEVPRTK